MPIIDCIPINIGSEWIYDFQQIDIKYETETSDKILDVNTMSHTLKVWIDKDTLLSGTIKVIEFKSILDDYIWTTSIKYQFLDNEGLKTYAYTSVSSEIDIFFEEKPTRDVELPLNHYSYWTYRELTGESPLQIDKKVVGNEIVSNFGLNYNSYKIKMELFL